MQIHLEESFSLQAYQQVFDTKANLYQNYQSTIGSNSPFENINNFTTHYNELMITIPNML
jgi:hypothetical protein